MAFKIAASLAFKKGIVEANPVLLEPIMRVEITVPEEYMGDIMGDLNRGGVRSWEWNPCRTEARKLLRRCPRLRCSSMPLPACHDAGKGTFTMKFERYEEVPPHIARKLSKKQRENSNSIYIFYQRETPLCIRMVEFLFTKSGADGEYVGRAGNEVMHGKERNHCFCMPGMRQREPKWMGQCICGAWNSMVEEKVLPASAEDKRRRKLRTEQLKL